MLFGNGILCIRTFATGNSLHRLRAQGLCSATFRVQSWQRRQTRLGHLLRRIKCPRVHSFEVNGRSYQLPVSACVPTGQPSESELDYLRGFFDGDGCVSLNAASGKCCLTVGQAINRGSILIRFRQALGGGIYLCHNACGFRRAYLMWKVGGRSAQEAAKLLGSLPSMKQQQLRIAMQDTADRGNVADQLKALKILKQHDHTPDYISFSWEYIAGFFDAEGCISVTARRPSVALAFSQVNPFILRGVQSFFKSKALGGWSLHQRSRGEWSLECSRANEVKTTLQHFLAHGLTLKRTQAELSMSLTTQNHNQVREAVSELNGYQAFYRRLDEAGIARAKEIAKVQRLIRAKRLAVQSDQRGLEALELELYRLRDEHAYQKLVSRCSKLRSHIRRLLREGATIAPLA